MAHHVVDEAARAWTYVGMGSLSLLGSSYIIVTYAADRMLHTKTLSMVVCLAVCDFIYTCKFILTAIGYLAGANWNRAHTFECVGFGVIGQFFGLASCSWFMMIAINVWCMLMYPFTYKTAKHLWKYHAWVWGVSAVTTGIVGAFNDFGPSGDATCWIQGGDNPLRLLFFVPLVAYWCATSLVLTQLLCCSRATKTMQTKQQVRFQAAKRLSRFAAVFALCWVGQAMGRVGEAVVGQHHTPTWLEYLESFGNTAVGLLNGISWGLMLRRQARMKHDRAIGSMKMRLVGSHGGDDSSATATPGLQLHRQSYFRCCACFHRIRRRCCGRSDGDSDSDGEGTEYGHASSSTVARESGGNWEPNPLHGARHSHGQGHSRHGHGRGRTSGTSTGRQARSSKRTSRVARSHHNSRRPGGGGGGGSGGSAGAGEAGDGSGALHVPLLNTVSD